uniref:Uncharacterized protein n=1 Tax=Helianthus annuus TaxID=4232 RepID=A0A251VKV0_HELAN
MGKSKDWLINSNINLFVLLMSYITASMAEIPPICLPLNSDSYSDSMILTTGNSPFPFFKWIQDVSYIGASQYKGAILLRRRLHMTMYISV